MSEAYVWVKTLHILSATVLFGTGLGTAFYMLRAHMSGDARIIAAVAREVALADFLFTAPAVVIQPLSGAALIWLTAVDPLSFWLVLTYALYLLTGLCWLPVVWLQIRARDLASAAAAGGLPLPPAYHRAMRAWFLLGWPAFIAVMAIVWLMVAKPLL
jgi:uncharacterized membrane protein